jgi:hypothetical protein
MLCFSLYVLLQLFLLCVPDSVFSASDSDGFIAIPEEKFWSGEMVFAGFLVLLLSFSLCLSGEIVFFFGQSRNRFLHTL